MHSTFLRVARSMTVPKDPDVGTGDVVWVVRVSVMLTRSTVVTGEWAPG